MIRLLSLVIALAALSSLRAEEKFDYATALALAEERTLKKQENNIFVIGPIQTEEFYFANGKELKRMVPYCNAFAFNLARNIQQVLGQGNILAAMGNGSYSVTVYRPESATPAVRLQGASSSLNSSQYPLKQGDIIVINPMPSSK